MKAIEKVQFDEYDRIIDSKTKETKEEKTIEQILTEAELFIQNNTSHKIVTQEIHHEEGSNSALFKKNRKYYEDIILKVVIRIPK